MNPNWLGVIAANLAFVAFFFAYRFAAKADRKTRAVFLAVTALLAVPGASFAVYYAHLLPEPAWYYQFRSIPGTEFLLVFVGAAGGALTPFMRRSLLAFPLLGVAAFVLAPVAKPFLAPFGPGELGDIWHEEICLQSTGATCGAASLATVLKHFGKDATEPEIAAEAHSYQGGTEAWYLARSARSRGLDVRFETDSEFPADGALPAVVGVRFSHAGHFIAIVKREGDQFLTGDPLRGKRMQSRDELLAEYDFTGFAMRVSEGTGE